MADLLNAAGYQVHREYYVNDAGSQMAKLGESLYVRYCELLDRDPPEDSGLRAGEIPEGGYQGEYVAEWAQKIIDRDGEVHPLPFGIKDADSLLEALQPYLEAGM